ncbi:MAG: prepilin-type N-terminal cleavage/methylation domain-containing protein, partial [Nitrospinaceae bacterium]|nr:prepilin-type N-terminal cleavage/methylation domain-containing protein [Nitrospinaceae bacterium]NIR53788.1 prepilin-type N-terminal cleavage/methylation domain-containing protein [Nitrospinaceae bacterium]NIS84198.1 prepilin-type N-terminal cleavage/methylation domain-containing protein [Nitrospinaceae bacterium]NIT81004.1 prepilin-type N-terminal cleavage/methylation domain-containing protein [Nitrospinaceae bacterium]NIU43294.1 prepilin-type N-terminal cleavage/methylation domain-contain
MNAIGNRKGFTLIELILGIVVAGLLGLFTLQYLSRVAQTNQLLSGQKTLVDEGQR